MPNKGSQAPAIKGAGDLEMHPGPPSDTPCDQCHLLHVRSLTTPVRIYHHCRSCHHSWNVPNPQAR